MLCYVLSGLEGDFGAWHSKFWSNLQRLQTRSADSAKSCTEGVSCGGKCTCTKSEEEEGDCNSQDEVIFQ